MIFFLDFFSVQTISVGQVYYQNCANYKFMWRYDSGTNNIDLFIVVLLLFQLVWIRLEENSTQSVISLDVAGSFFGTTLFLPLIVHVFLRQ